MLLLFAEGERVRVRFCRTDGHTSVVFRPSSAMDSCGSSRRSSASSAAPSASSLSNDNDDWFDEVDTCGLEDEQVRKMGISHDFRDNRHYDLK